MNKDDNSFTSLIEVESDLNHLSKTLTGFCSYIHNEDEELQYYNAFIKANGFVHGIEAGYWDKIKESSGEIYRTLSTIIKNVTQFFTGDGQKQIDDAKIKSKEIIDAINKIDPRIPIDGNNRLLKKERYFKPPTLNDVDKEDSDDLTKAIKTIEDAVAKLGNVKTVGDLYDTFKAIQTASLTSSQMITDKIRQKASVANTLANKVQKVKTPKEGDEKEIKDALKQESTETFDEAKRKTQALRKLASLRNRFLAPTMVIVGSLSDIQSLQNKTFKG